MIIGIFTHFFALETTLAERQFFRALAKLVGRRAARLSACGIAAIVSKMNYLDEGCAVGADGSLYNVRTAGLARSAGSEVPWTEIPRVRGSRARGIARRLWRQRPVSRETGPVSLRSDLKPSRNIVTYHAEDGSGVGSAIIASARRNLHPLTPHMTLLSF